MENKLVPVQMNEVVQSVLSKSDIQGFEKAYIMSEAIGKIKGMLTHEYMKPIMELQGSRLGFKSDKVYNEEKVKEVLIEAVFLGVQPYGNEFNIIAGNCYLTKEGLGSLLKRISGLWYQVTPSLPRIKPDMSGAAIEMTIDWSINGGNQQSKTIDVPVKMNKMMGTDAVIGKATRKARHWLYSFITGVDIPEGDVTDVDFKIVQTKKPLEEIKNEQEIENLKNHINKSDSLEKLNEVEGVVEQYGLEFEFNEKKEKLK